MIEQLSALAAIIFVAVAFVAWRESNTRLLFFAWGAVVDPVVVDPAFSRGTLSRGALFAASLASDALWLFWMSSGKVRLASPDGFGLVIGLLMMIVAVTHQQKKTA